MSSSKEREVKQVRKKMVCSLTKGCMLANDGSDDTVDADPLARSKNETANQIKKRQSETFA
jgi:hypothetical protein